MRTIFWLFLILAFSQSCKPKYSGPTVAQGQVVDATTGQGIPYADVILMRDKGGSAMYRTIMESKRTDEEGKFSFTVETEEEYSYLLDAETFYYFKGAEGGRLQSGEKNENLKLRIRPKGYVKFKIINERDTEYSQVGVSGSFNPSIILNDKHKDTVIYREMRGNVNNDITVVRTTRSGSTQAYTQLYIPALDTIDFEIKY